MSAGAVLLTFAIVVIAASLLLALIFRFWPRYGSVEAAIAQTDQLLETMEAAAQSSH